jgi:hypothetical protein
MEQPDEQQEIFSDRPPYRSDSTGPLYFSTGFIVPLSTGIPRKMDVPDLLPQIEQLDDNVDDLEEAIAPLLNQPLTETAKKLPVLDKAKLHVWTTYALENLIFCESFDLPQ